MGLLQQAYRTYNAMEGKYMGAYEEGKEPLCPVSHIMATANIEITLDEQGHFVDACAVDKSEVKIIIPATEDSAGRTSAPSPHPLCDQLSYLGGYDKRKYELYLDQLGKWVNSPWTHPKARAVLAYIQSGTILSDLSGRKLIKLNEQGVPDKEKLLVRWKVLNPLSDDPEECWKDRSLFQSFISYYASTQEGDQLCMVSGEQTAAAKQHPKGVVALYGNAKLISANDQSGFTYRGRFSEDWQAASVSYAVSQKAHAALRWVVANQGARFGGRVFLCWSPQGVSIPQGHTSLLPRKDKTIIKASDYQKELQRTLLGIKETLPKDAQAVVAALDAATTGRLSVTYYNELLGSDFLDRLHLWDCSCCWWNGPYGLQAPWLKEIVDCAFGVHRIENKQPKLVTDDRIMGQQLQRLIACRVDGARMPADILHAVVNRVSRPEALDPGLWRKMVFTACAVIQKYHAPMLKEDICMNWTLDRADRSFQFGRLLAAMERAEADFYQKTGEERQTNAIKYLAEFKRTPWTTFERLHAHLEQAYLWRIEPRSRKRYERLKDEIVSNILNIADETELNKPLSEFYLIGYELQRNAIFTPKESNEETTEYEEE